MLQSGAMSGGARAQRRGVLTASRETRGLQVQLAASVHRNGQFGAWSPRQPQWQHWGALWVTALVQTAWSPLWSSTGVCATVERGLEELLGAEYMVAGWWVVCVWWW